MDETEDEVFRALDQWPLSKPLVLEEVKHGGRASRVWLVRSPGGPWVAKLIFDRPEYAEPGLRVAQAVAEAGVRSGPPLPTSDGRIAVTLERPGGPSTLAVLRFELGVPLDVRAPGSAARAGTLLATVHGALLDARPPPAVPARLLDWFAQVFTERSSSDGLKALDDLRRFEERTPLTYGVVYGDPSPEVLVDEHTGSLALIDWGTPSWGPLMYDVATWAGFMTPGAEGETGSDLVAAYKERSRLQPGEYAALPLLGSLRRCLRPGHPGPHDDRFTAAR